MANFLALTTSYFVTVAVLASSSKLSHERLDRLLAEHALELGVEILGDVLECPPLLGVIDSSHS